MPPRARTVEREHPASIEDPKERLLAAKRFLLSKGHLCRQAYSVDVDTITSVATSGIAKTAVLAIRDDRLIVARVFDGWDLPQSPQEADSAKP